jgi:hypothetical protein
VIAMGVVNETYFHGAMFGVNAFQWIQFCWWMWCILRTWLQRSCASILMFIGSVIGGRDNKRRRHLCYANRVCSSYLFEDRILCIFCHCSCDCRSHSDRRNDENVHQYHRCLRSQMRLGRKISIVEIPS